MVMLQPGCVLKGGTPQFFMRFKNVGNHLGIEIYFWGVPQRIVSFEAGPPKWIVCSSGEPSTNQGFFSFSVAVVGIVYLNASVFLRGSGLEKSTARMGTPSLQVLLGIYTIFGPLNPMVPLSLRGNFDPEASQQASNSMLQFLLPEGLPHSSSTVGNGRCMPHFSRFSIWSRFVEEERNHAVQVKSTTFAFHFLGRGVLGYGSDLYHPRNMEI